MQGRACVPIPPMKPGLYGLVRTDCASQASFERGLVGALGRRTAVGHVRTEAAGCLLALAAVARRPVSSSITCVQPQFHLLSHPLSHRRGRQQLRSDAPLHQQRATDDLGQRAVRGTARRHPTGPQAPGRSAGKEDPSGQLFIQGRHAGVIPGVGHAQAGRRLEHRWGQGLVATTCARGARLRKWAPRWLMTVSIRRGQGWRRPCDSEWSGWSPRDRFGRSNLRPEAFDQLPISAVTTYAF